MPIMKILNSDERETFEIPPVFSGVDRQKYFEFLLKIIRFIKSLRTPTNQVCFLVAFGYFKATKMFFSKKFHQKDVGVKYNVNARIRSAEEVAANLVYPERIKEDDKNKSPKKGENIRYIASLEQPKKKVMEEIKDQIEGENFIINPLVCVMDGAPYLWKLFKNIYEEIKK